MAAIWCLLVMGLSIISPAARALDPTDCEEGWIHLNKTGACYKSIPDRLSFASARDHCISLGASLARSRSPEEEQFVQNLGGRDFWLGGNDLAEEGLWTWLDGSPFTWTNWGSGYPRHLTNDNCLVEKGDQLWVDIHCGNAYKFMCYKQDVVRLAGGATKYEGRVEVYRNGSWGTVCDQGWDDTDAGQLGYVGGVARPREYGPGQGQIWYSSVDCQGTENYFAECPKTGINNNSCSHDIDAGVKCQDCGDGWKYFHESGLCYKEIPMSLSYTLAIKHCKTLGGSLAASKSLKEEHNIINTLSSYGFAHWLGGDDITMEGQWTWLDGSPFTWTNWRPGYPMNQADHDCLLWSWTDGWIDHNCLQGHYFICSKSNNSGITEESTTATSLPAPTPSLTRTTPQLTTRSQEHIAVPVVTGVFPAHGPVSGGTKLTVSVTGQQQTQLTAVRVGNSPLTNFTRKSTGITGFTPAGSSVNQELPVKLVLDSGAVITTKFTFTYKYDPEVSKIYPLVTTISGGTRLTVEGKNFGFVENRKLLLTISPIKETQIQKAKLENRCDKNSVDNDKMICRTPATIGHIKEEEINDYRLYIGLELDGVLTYRNLSASLPKYSQLHLYLDPELFTFKDEEIIQPGNPLRIQGKSMSKGCSKDDYTVGIGHGQCEIQELLDNELWCLPPEAMPVQKDEEVSLGESRYHLFVKVGYSALHQIGTVRYRNNGNTLLYIIIGASLAGFLILIIIIACVCNKRRAGRGKLWKDGNGEACDLSENHAARKGRDNLATTMEIREIVAGGSGQDGESPGDTDEGYLPPT